jgi:hypothetical protein
MPCRTGLLALAAGGLSPFVLGLLMNEPARFHRLGQEPEVHAVRVRVDIGRQPEAVILIAEASGSGRTLWAERFSGWEQWTGSLDDLLAAIEASQREAPFEWGRHSDGRHIWQYRGDFFATTEALTGSEVAALVDARELRKKRAIERAQATVDSGGGLVHFSYSALRRGEDDRLAPRRRPLQAVRFEREPGV